MLLTSIVDLLNYLTYFMSEMQAGESASKAYDQAVRYLALRSHTAFELKNKLKKKKFSIGEIEQVLTRLKEQKYINDEDFARTFVQNLIKYKTFGYYGIKIKLKQRGIDEVSAQRVLDEELDLESERKVAEKLMAKSGKKDDLKIFQMLKRKGFRNQIISAFNLDIYESE